MMSNKSLIKQKIVNYLIEKRVLKIIKSYLSFGVYRFDYIAGQIVMTNILYAILHPALCHICWSFKIGQKQISFFKGSRKMVIPIGNKILNITYKRKQYNKLKNNYILYHSDLSFAYPKIIQFNDKNCTFVQERVYGKSFRDSAHDKITMDYILKYSLKSKIDREKRMMLQHGDAWRENILFTQNGICMIDLDQISYRPILFDLILFSASIRMNAKALCSYLLENGNAIDRIANKFDLFITPPRLLDYIFSNYVDYCKKRNRIKNNYVFLDGLDDLHFPLTKEKLHTNNN